MLLAQLQCTKDMTHRRNNWCGVKYNISLKCIYWLVLKWVESFRPFQNHHVKMHNHPDILDQHWMCFRQPDLSRKQFPENGSLACEESQKRAGSFYLYTAGILCTLTSLDTQVAPLSFRHCTVQLVIYCQQVCF